MILVTAYYVIEPTLSFKKKLVNLDIDNALVEILSETVLWSYHRAGNTEDDISEVKLLFLANLMSEYLEIEVYKKVLDTFSISLDVFDKWWTIKRYFVDEVFSEIEKRIDPSVASHLIKTDRKRVDLWIDKMQGKI
ncbi:MAG: hypothetical protein F6K32_11935 [Desertifilum sp. SIO1I2]|nr:hypothetical protein [Desertifilum sp. SIO1I2]